MTVSYQRHLAHSNSGGFARLLFKWRGSLYGLIYKELFSFIIAFGMVSAIYRNVLSDSAKLTFNKAILYCEALEKLLPLPFILGFYVMYILQRWWSQFQTIPWPDSIMHLLTLSVVKNEEYDRMMLRSLIRYTNLSLILVLRSISFAVKRRFPKLEDLVNAGLMTAEELELFRSVPNADITTYWIPSTWFMHLLREGSQRNRFQNGPPVSNIAKEFNSFREKCDRLWTYDWLPMPLVYTQVVTLITYGYFFIALIGRQHIDDNGAGLPRQTELDKYISIISILQMLFFMGLLKVAEQLINPFGDDEEDFELNWLIDRNIKISYLGIDMVMKRGPTLVKDSLWDVEEISLPYPTDAENLKKKTHFGSVAHKEFSAPEDIIVTFADNLKEKQDDYSTESGKGRC